MEGQYLKSARRKPTLLAFNVVRKGVVLIVKEERQHVVFRATFLITGLIDEDAEVAHTCHLTCKIWGQPNTKLV